MVCRHLFGPERRCRAGCSLTVTYCHKYARGQCYRPAHSCRFVHRGSQFDPENQSRIPWQSSNSSPQLIADLKLFNLLDFSKVTEHLVAAMYRVYALDTHPDKAVPELKKEREKLFRDLKDASERLIERCQNRR